MRDQVWKPSNIFAYKYWSPQHTQEKGGNFAHWEKKTQKKTLILKTIFLSLGAAVLPLKLKEPQPPTFEIFWNTGRRPPGSLALSLPWPKSQGPTPPFQIPTFPRGISPSLSQQLLVSFHPTDPTTHSPEPVAAHNFLLPSSPVAPYTVPSPSHQHKTSASQPPLSASRRSPSPGRPSFPIIESSPTAAAPVLEQQPTTTFLSTSASRSSLPPPLRTQTSLSLRSRTTASKANRRYHEPDWRPSSSNPYTAVPPGSRQAPGEKEMKT